MHAIAIALAAGALALCVTAISLLPFLEALPLTFDYRMRQAAVAHGPTAADAHNVVKAMRATFVPYSGGASWYGMTGDWDVGAARVGSIVLALAAVAAIKLWRRREVQFFLVLGVVTMLVGWQWPPIAMPVQRLPLFNMALNDRLGIAAAFSFAMLAAMALDHLDRRVVAGVAIALAATMFAWHAHDPKLMLAGIAAESLVLVLLVLPRPTPVLLVLLALTAQRFVEDANVYPNVPRNWFYPRVPLVDKVPRDPLYRVVATGNLLVPNVGTMYGLEDVRGYASMTYYPYFLTMPLWCPDAKRVYHDVNDLSRPFLSFLGVRYAFTPVTLAPPEGWRVVADDRDTRLMENTRAIPRVFVPRHVRFIDNHEATMEEMSAASDFADVAWIYTHDVPPHTIDNGAAELRVRRPASTRFEIDANVRGGAHLVISETAWPGWRAYVDGKRVNVARANRAFLSVYVPSGQHHVRVVYLPDSFVRGRAITFVTLMLIAVAVVTRSWRSTRSSLQHL